MKHVFLNYSGFWELFGSVQPLNLPPQVGDAKLFCVQTFANEGSVLGCKAEEQALSPNGNQVAFEWQGEQTNNSNIPVKLVRTRRAAGRMADPVPKRYDREGYGNCGWLQTSRLGMSISPDRHTLLYAQMDQEGSDLMYVDNVR